ncbi:MAG: DUF2281 domain-containing protein [Saprospiraceae bacterium]|jgi:hypothetical protein|nr:DUF2281 domain-containing protein [Saprospiraceae bacterium]
MSSISLIHQKLQKLPIALQEEVLQFIDYLFFKSNSAKTETTVSVLKPVEPKPNSFAWAGALKGQDEGLSAVEWQHKISDLMVADAMLSTTK